MIRMAEMLRAHSTMPFRQFLVGGGMNNLPKPASRHEQWSWIINSDTKRAKQKASAENVRNYRHYAISASLRIFLLPDLNVVASISLVCSSWFLNEQTSSNNRHGRNNDSKCLCGSSLWALIKVLPTSSMKSAWNSSALSGGSKLVRE